MPRADFLDEKRKEIDARVKELEPLVEEYRRLEAAAAALDGVADRPGGNGRPRRAPARGAEPVRRRRAAPGRGAATARNGTRGAEALAIVRSRPGITVREVAERMGIERNYLYRVLPRLAQDGLIVREAGGWKATESG